MELSTGESEQLQFQIPSEHLMLVDEDGVARLVPGSYRLIVGGCSPGEFSQALGAPQPVGADFSVTA